eukprot:m.67837 g.67837  ORF g.67837 m.67837 type:complete len:303 (-) comp8228_c1_seq1:714-1622(-)
MTSTKASSQDEFLATFKEKVAVVQEELEKLEEGMDRNHLLEQFDDLMKQHAEIGKFLTDHTFHLPAYDVRSRQQTLSKLLSEISAKKRKLVPRKKFAFKAMKQRVAEKKPEVVKDLKSTENAPEESFFGFRDEEGKTLSLSREELNSADLALKNLTNCEVWLQGTPGVVHISHLKDCLVMIGPVHRSLLLDDCVGCTFVLACQQLRIHNTTKTNFYIHVTSRAIIEDCHEVEFAPYAWKYEELEEDFKVAGLDTSTNNWNMVNDFKWLKPHEHSPNWKVKEEDERRFWNGIEEKQVEGESNK